MCKSRVGFVMAASLAAMAAAQAPRGNPETFKLSAPVTSIALSAMSNRAAVVSRDSKLTVWDLAAGRLLRTIGLATAEIDVTTISDDGRWIFTGDHVGNASVWDSNTGEARLQLRLPHYAGAAAFSSDSKLIAIAPAGEPIQVFDLGSGKMLFQTAAVAGGTEALAFSRDASSMAAADADTVVRVYDARAGKLVAENRDFLLEPLALDFTFDGRQVIAGGGDKLVVVLDAAGGKAIRRLQDADEPVRRGRAGPSSSIKVSPDGSLVAAILMKAENMNEPGPLVVWEVASGREKSQWMPPKLARCMDWTRDGHLIALGADADSLYVWRVP